MTVGHTHAVTAWLPFGSLVLIPPFPSQALNNPLKDIHIKSLQDIENEVKYQSLSVSVLRVVSPY